MEKEKKPIYKQWWFFIVMILLLVICFSMKNNDNNNISVNANEVKEEALKADLNKKNTVGNLTYYVQDSWENKEDKNDNTVNEYYYPTKDTLLMIMISSNTTLGEDATVFLDSYIAGMNLNDNDFISKSSKKINGYNCGIVRNYINSGNERYETVSYIIANHTEGYVFTIGQKDALKNSWIDLIEDIIKKCIIIEAKNKIVVIDFSQMTETDIQTWCTTNKVIYDRKNAYSDTVEKEAFISQSVEANGIIEEGDKITVTYSLGREPTLGERNALSKAKDYLAYTSFSYKGLVEQLEYEGFSKEESTYGVDNCGADWNEQAAKKAKSYMNYTSFSKSGLIDQLKYEGFTNEQAQYGATAVGY